MLAAKASKPQAEQVIGRPLPDELFDFTLVWGRRLLIVAESPERTYGHIVIPKSIQAREPKTTGWVIAAGPLVGEPASGLPGWSPYLPQDLILKRVLFSAFAGVELPVVEDPGTKSDREFADWVEAGEGGSGEVLARPYLIISDGDVYWSY